MKPVTTAAVVLLGILALTHLYRVIRPFEVFVAGHAIPQWASIVGFIVAGGISLMLWREAQSAP